MGPVPLGPVLEGVTGPWRDQMKCPHCRAMIDDGLERCTFCGTYLSGSMMDDYKLDNYDPTANYRPQPQYQQYSKPSRKPKFKLFKK